MPRPASGGDRLGAPAIFLFMSQQPAFHDTDLSSIQTLICGAAPVPESLIEVYASRDEVEGVLYHHEAIAEVAVIGLPDEKWGEAVTAVAALNPGCELTLEQLRDCAESRLARYKLPLHLIEALPRNPAGKVLKYVLKEQFSD